MGTLMLVELLLYTQFPTRPGVHHGRLSTEIAPSRVARRRGMESIRSKLAKATLSRSMTLQQAERDLLHKDTELDLAPYAVRPWNEHHPRAYSYGPSSWQSGYPKTLPGPGVCD